MKNGSNASNLQCSKLFEERSTDKSSVIPTFLKLVVSNRKSKVCGDGSQVREYIYAKDLCWVILTYVSRNLTGTYHPSLGEGMPLNELPDVNADITCAGSNQA